MGAVPPLLPALTGVGVMAKGSYLKREVFIRRGVQHVADLESKRSHLDTDQKEEGRGSKGFLPRPPALASTLFTLGLARPTELKTR